MITRRKAMQHLGVAAGAAALGPRLTGCGEDGGGGDGGDGGGPGEITHLVQICMENRTYDHWLGGRKLAGKANAGDGLTAGHGNPDAGGNLVEVYPADAMCVGDPPHSWGSSHLQWNQGAMDGFLREYQARFGAGVEPVVLSYMTEAHLPVTWALADQYTVCDRWFSAVMGPTWPNRLYLHSGQSGGLNKNELPPNGSFSWDTVYHRLRAKGVSWRYYWSDLPVAALWDDLVNDVDVQRLGDFFDDCESGTLPQVTVVDPAFAANDDHPPHHPLLGQQFIASVIDAVARSEYWEKCLIVVTYDEHGGFYDHVAPPKVPDERAADGFDQLGMRVPTLLVGPWVKTGHVESTQLEHTSWIKQLSGMFGLEPLTMRDASANDLGAALDLERMAAGEPAPPPVLPPVMVDESMLDEACYKRGARYKDYEPSDWERLADTGFFGKRDLRAQLPDTLRLIAERLERRGLGGYRRGR